MWRTEWEMWKNKGGQGEPSKHIYVAAPADMVAAFLLALVLCLPDALLEGLTFTTYEKDVQAAGGAIIVGTTFTDEMLTARADLPPSCYENDIVLNCYASKLPSFESYPLFVLATIVTKDIVQRLTTKKGRYRLRQFKDRKDFTKNTQNVNVKMFLGDYKRDVIDGQVRSKEQFEAVSQRPTSAKEHLGEPGAAEFYVEQALLDTSWGMNEFIRGLKSLCSFAKEPDMEDLKEALFTVGRLTATKSAEAVVQGQWGGAAAMLNSMVAVSSLSVECKTTTWRTAFDSFKQVQEVREDTIVAFFEKNYSFYLLVCKSWASVIPGTDDPFITFLLQGRLPWQDSEVFFAPTMPLSWKVVALYSGSIPEAQKQALGPNMGATITTILKHYVNDEPNWPQAIDFYKTFEAAPAQYKQPWKQLLLDSPRSAGHEQTLITPADRLWFLQYYGPMYFPVQRAESIATQFKYIQTFSDKFAVLSTWLYPPFQGRDARPIGFRQWLDSPMNWANMETILRIARLQSNEEITTFLENYGIYYLNLYDRRYLTSGRTYMGSLLKKYLDDLDEATLYSSPPTHNFITFLSNKRASLPSDIQERLTTFTRFDDAFQQNPDNLNLVIAIANLLEQQSTNRAVLYEKLAQRFVENIYDETYLSEVLDTIRDTSPPFTRNDLFQILFVIAHIVRDNMAQPIPFLTEQVVLYVNFALFADVVFVKSDAPADTRCEQDISLLFQKNFLDRLLEGMNASTFNTLEQKLTGESQQRLKHYRENRVSETPHYQLTRWLQQLRVNRQALRTELVRVFVDQISNETYLAEMIRTMTASFKLDDLFQILFMMAQSVHDEIMQESTTLRVDRVVLYVGFALHAESIFVKLMQQSATPYNHYIYGLFQKNFLARLLEGVNTSILKELHRRLTGADSKRLAEIGYKLHISNYPLASAQDNKAHTSQPTTKGVPLLARVRAFLQERRQRDIQQPAMAETHQVSQPTSQANGEIGYFDANTQQTEEKSVLSNVTSMFGKPAGRGRNTKLKKTKS